MIPGARAGERVGLLADVHANLPALEAVLADMPPVDGVGYGPHPAAVVDALRARGVTAVRGNHDRAVAAGAGFERGGASAGVAHARDRLDDGQLAWLAGLPATRSAREGRLFVAHGHPTDPDRYVYPALFGPELLAASPGDPAALVLGHTHVQSHTQVDGHIQVDGRQRVGSGVVVNPGSVGQPRDGDPRAAYAVLDLTSLAVEERRVDYDVESVVADCRDAGLPEANGARLRKGR